MPLRYGYRNTENQGGLIVTEQVDHPLPHWVDNTEGMERYVLAHETTDGYFTEVFAIPVDEEHIAHIGTSAVLMGRASDCSMAMIPPGLSHEVTIEEEPGSPKRLVIQHVLPNGFVNSLN